MSEILIEKVKLIKGESLDIEVRRKQADGTYTSSAESYKRKIHPDIQDKLNSLVPHLAVLTGYHTVKSIKDINKPNMEHFDTFKVNSYSIGGKEGSEGITISGHNLVPTGGAVILNSPFKRFEEGDETRYVFMDNLESILNELEEEVKSYMDGSKVGIDPQGELAFESSKEDSE